MLDFDHLLQMTPPWVPNEDLKNELDCRNFTNQSLKDTPIPGWDTQCYTMDQLKFVPWNFTLNKAPSIKEMEIRLEFLDPPPSFLTINIIVFVYTHEVGLA